MARDPEEPRDSGATHLVVASSETSSEKRHHQEQSSSFVFFKRLERTQTNQLTYTTTEERTNTLIHTYINTHANKQISIAETTISSKAHLIDGGHVERYGRLRLGER